MASTTAVSIVNDALVELGVGASNLISALGDGTRNSDYASQVYDEVLNQELRGHAWNFARSRAKLAEADMGTWSQAVSGSHAFGDAAAADSKHAGLLFKCTAGAAVKRIRVNVAAFTAAGACKAKIYTNASGSPGVQVGGDSDAETISGTGEVAFEWSSESDRPRLAAGTSYWAIVSNSEDTTLSVTLDDVADQGSNFASGKHDTITSIADQTGNFDAADDWRFEVLLKPLSGFDFLFALPSDFLRLVQAWDNDADQGNLRYELADRKLACDADEVWISYIRDEAEPANFDPLFRDALVYRIASRLAIPVAASPGLKDRMAALYKASIRRARAADAIEDFPERFPQSPWVTARGGGRYQDWGIW